VRFSFVLDRIVHLPVPSENVSRRGKRILNLNAEHGSGSGEMGSGAETRERKMNQAVGDKISPCRMSLRVSAPANGLLPMGTRIHFFPSKFES
jgi:hypothetical protein